MIGTYNLSDIAEKLQVELKMVEFACKYYKDNGQLFTNEEMLNESI